jgi:hypothetical protein
VPACLLMAASVAGARSVVPARDAATRTTSDLFHLRVTVTARGGTRPFADEWFSPGSGAFSVRFAGHAGAGISNDTHVAYLLDGETYQRTTGSAAFLKALSIPLLPARPGAAALQTYLARDHGITARPVRGRLVLSLQIQPYENSDEKIGFAATVLERVTLAQAQARHVFEHPTATSTRRQHAPGERAANGIHAWWIGPTHGSRPAVSAWEETTQRPTRTNPASSYTTVYWDAGLARSDPSRFWPRWPTARARR